MNTTPLPTRHPKAITSDAAAALVADGKTLATGGFCGAAHPEGLVSAVERRFLAGNGPHDLTLIYGAGQGDGGARGLNHFGHEGLVRRVIGGHWRLIPRIADLAIADKIEAVNFPQGVMCQLYRDIAAGRPGCITHVGLGTFIDPAHPSENAGGRLNTRSPSDLIQRVQIGEQELLWYKAFPIDVALIRATTADPAGSLTFENEAIRGEALALAQAAHNSGGLVIAQVQKLSDATAPPHHVVVPGVLVDHVVVAEEGEHDQTFAEPFDPRFCNQADPLRDSEACDPPPDPLLRRIIAARACDAIPDGAIVNLGIGLPEGITQIANERGKLEHFTLTVESGVFGGRPCGGLSFGTAIHPQAIIDQPAMFDFYDGGGLDFAALGAAQIDQHGNVNVSQFAGVIAGVGGFVNITQNAKNLVFCGSFTAGGLIPCWDGQRLQIQSEGKHRKFVQSVDQVSFNPLFCQAQEILYVTERCVFQIHREQSETCIELIEVAPGIDVQTQILDLMEFKPRIGTPREMPAHVFA